MKSTFLSLALICSTVWAFGQKDIPDWDAKIAEEASKYKVKFSVDGAQITDGHLSGWILTYQVFKPETPNRILDQNAYDLSMEDFVDLGNGKWGFDFSSIKTITAGTTLDLILSNEETGNADKKSFSLAGISYDGGDDLKVELSSGKLTNYMRLSDSVIFRSSRPRIYLYRFANTFSPSLPPFLNPASTSRELNMDSVFTVPTHTPLSLGDQQALYLAVVDSMSEEGIGFRTVPDDFPKYRVIDRLTDPLVYISTNTEYQSLERSVSKKLAIENHWMNLSRSSDLAGSLIKDYYSRVAYANERFTSTKDGWMTDRGMIYIVFGPPVEVNEFFDKIQWSYFSSVKNKRLIFTFQKKETVLSDNHYLLTNRTVDYRNDWIKAVDHWRNPSR